MFSTVRCSSVLAFLVFIIAVIEDEVETLDAFNGNNTSPDAESAVYRDSICGTMPLLVSRISYGHYAAEGNWPWHGALFRGSDYKCGCTLINEWFVLTAAHCVFNPETEARFDLRSLSVNLGLLTLDGYDSNARRYKLTAAKVHPLFVPSNHKHDVALLLLSSKAELSDFIRPIDVGYGESPWIEFLAGYLGTVVGWGFTEMDALSNVLMVAQMPIVRYTDCIESNPDLFGRLIHAGMYCAGAQNGTSVCNGDSGGGMYVYQNDKWLLRGIVSFSATRNDTNLCYMYGYAGFVNVPFYARWIQQQLLDHEKGLQQQQEARGPRAEDLNKGGAVKPRLDEAPSTELPAAIVQQPTESTTTAKPITPRGLPVSILPPECLQQHSDVIYAERDSSVSLHCRHNSSEKIQSIRWFHKGQNNRVIDITAQNGLDVNSVHEIVTLRHLQAYNSGKYFCLVQYANENFTDSRTLAVTGGIPRFDGSVEASYLKFTLLLRNDYLNLVITFKAEKSNGVLFHKESECDRQFLTVLLVDSIIAFEFRGSRGNIIRGIAVDAPVRLDQWHRLQIKSFRDRAYLSLDDRLLALFQMPAPNSNCVEQNIYLGSRGQNSTGFMGCIAELVLNDQSIDLWKESTKKHNVAQCHPCSATRCANDGVCIETSNGFNCVCKDGYVGKFCSQQGQSCNVRICNEGLCEEHETGFRCICPATRTGKHCERLSHLNASAIAFQSYGYVLYRLKIKRDFIMQFNFKSETVERSLVAYLIGESRGISNFLALVIVDGRLELRFAWDMELRPTVLKSSILLMKNAWHTVTVGCGNEFVYFSVDDELERTKGIFGDLLASDRDYSLYLGGIDKHSVVNRCADVKLGFHGCIDQLTVSDETIKMTEEFVDAKNIANCESNRIT
ncbi:uncharacterized protein LOC128737873 [Sabethes cyaneus]|uniref:uncharacterized protein LOC128737873 n=1 Tax=Sabethes cyaneus TaxID=53552 RepID=UPI00237E52A7|nr:uncharacterized protein LOC128737873 [Sabethes cyaneus]